MLLPLGGYEWVLMETNIDSGQGFTYPGRRCKCSEAIKKSEQKTLHQFGWAVVISSDQGPYFIAHNIQQ